MGINFAYAKGNERWRYVYLAVYDGKVPIVVSTGMVRYHTDVILDETAEMLSCSGRHPAADRSMQSKECDDVLLVRLDLSGAINLFALFCQISDLLLCKNVWRYQVYWVLGCRSMYNGRDGRTVVAYPLRGFF